MKKVSLEATDLTASELAKLAKKGTVILTANGKPLASVKNIAGHDWESVSLGNNPRFLALIEESRRAYREHGGVGIEQIRKELGLAPKRTGRLRRKRQQTV